MLVSVEHLRGYALLAADGEIGRAESLLFDDESWLVRYLLVDTGGWLTGRRVLIAPVALRTPDHAARRLPVELTRKQVEESPDMDLRQPVSRQEEMELFRHYAWVPYWPGSELGDIAPIFPAEESEGETDPHLRNTREVEGYRIAATDGLLGHVEDFILQEERWAIRYLVVDVGRWLAGRRVLLAPSWVENIDWGAREVVVNLSRDEVRGSPEYDPSKPLTREYEEGLHRHYDRPRYW